jgi:hypothetical protein
MLACNVSLLQRRAAIAADIAEVAEALDALGTGNVVFATLVDDPASVGDLTDAFLGDIMLEAASADAVADAGFPYAAAVAETSASADTPDAVVVSAPATAWDSATGINISLSNANLTATAATAAQAQVRASTSRASGKYYFEVTCGGTIQNSAVGVSTSAPGGTTLAFSQGSFVNVANGAIFIGGASSGFSTGGAFVAGDVACIALDLGSKRVWFRRNNGLWENSGTDNPATNTGGLDVSAYFASAAAFPIVTFTSTGLSHTGNFGATSFAYSAPSGFSSWG